mmetsp:Transcript_3351/g.7464  ORF Transcript_3351/g.7464 Transcript_3351/m.7464 type:complete len:119 (-) Transcript_3351:2141-2497(-)
MVGDAWPLNSTSHASGKISIVKKAEAHAEASYLSGYGTARERMMIVKGLKESAQSLGQDHSSFKEVMDIILVTQYLDTLAAIGTNEMVLLHGPVEGFSIRDRLGEVRDTRTSQRERKE